MSSPTPRTPIAVVGVSAIFPGSTDRRGFWRDIVTGRDLVTDVPENYWLIDDYYDADPSTPDRTYGKRGAFLGELDFDPLAWGVPPNIVPATDTLQLLSLVAARRVLEDACGGDLDSLDKERVGVILGVTSGQKLMGSMIGRLQRPMWIKGMRDAGIPEDEVERAVTAIEANYVPWQESTFPGLLGNVVAGRIANRLDLGGTNCVTDAACASSFAAVRMGIAELESGRSDLMVTGGTDTMNDIFMYMCFSKTPALSMTGDCRPFSDQADGTILGEGICMLALKRLDDAERDGDRIWAVIKGVGSSSDGRSKSVYAPVAEGQAKALRRAYADAGYGTETVELVEAHGTGTKAGDAAEFGGLRMVFEESGRKDAGWCSLGSVKSQIGHTKAAAGAAGLFKAVMALRHGVLPPSIKIDRPNPNLDLESSPFRLGTEARPWIRGGDHPRRAGVSSFGFGGSNFHVAVEEYVGPGAKAARLRTAPTELVTLSADTPAALTAKARALADEAEAGAGAEGLLSFLAWSSHGGQGAKSEAGAARLAVVAEDAADLAKRLRSAADAIDRAPEQELSLPGGTRYALGAGERTAGTIGLLFPGQGSQRVGMGGDLAMALSSARRIWDRAADSEFAEGGRLHEVVFPAPAFDEEGRAAHEARLRRTQWAQPAIGVASLATWQVLRELGLQPACAAGHSFGEVTALAAAGVLDEAGLLAVARARGELMARAAANGASGGAMAAVSLDVDAVRKALADLGDNSVVVANHNAPDQVVISGPAQSVEDAMKTLDAQGARARRLPVATAFHSPIVAGACGPFAQALQDTEFTAPTLQAWSGAGAAPHSEDPAAIRSALADAIAQPVRFVEQIEAMYAAGVRTFVEVGPGAVLTGLVGRILGDRPHTAVATDRKGKHGLTALHEALATLTATAGLELDLAPLWAEQEAPADPRVAMAARSKATLEISGANYGHPYPPKGGSAALPAPVPARPTPAPERIIVREEAPTVVQSQAAPAPSGDWGNAYEETLRLTTQAHSDYQQLMADSHLAYLKVMEAAATGQPAQHVPATSPVRAVAPPAPVPIPTPVVSAPPPTPAPVVAVAPVAAPAAGLRDQLLAVVADKTGYPVEMLTEEMDLEADLGVDSIKRVEILSALNEAVPGLPEVDARELGALRTLGEIAAKFGTGVPAVVAPATAGLRDQLLAVVADKTGYPVEMLTEEMDLEADLGVDSIKRVEILSALNEAVPGLPEVDARELGALRTLGEIAAKFDNGAPAQAPVAAPAAAPASAQAASGGDLRAQLLAVVADKTGYPVEMLTEEMDLEADLGVDSIKRVEILSALNEAVPGLAEVDARELGALRTLGEIAAKFDTDGAPEAQTLGRWGLELVDAPALGLSQPGLHTDGEVLVLGGGGVGGALVLSLAARGVKARQAGEATAQAAGVVFLGGLEPVGGADDGRAIALQAFQAAQAAAGQVGLFVTVQDTGGDFGLSGAGGRAWTAGLPGLVKTAAQEWPGVSLKAIDIDVAGRPTDAVAEALADELFAGGPELEVALGAGGERRTLAAVVRAEAPTRAPAAGATLSDADVIVASGGARGVTAAALTALARRVKARFVLLGRTPLVDEPASCAGAADDAGIKKALLADAQASGAGVTPAELGRTARRILAAREVRTTLAGLQAAGAEARYVATDVQDRQALAAALDNVRSEWGPISGLVHGAGVLADKQIVDKDVAGWERVYDTKVLGLSALLDATAGDPLKVIVPFSSVAGRCGNAGQSDYAMANEVLNKVAQAEAARRGDGCVVRSLGWGPWAGGMVTPGLAAQFERAGVALIPIDAGAELFADEVLAGPGDVEVVIGGEPKPEALVGGGAADGDVLNLAVRLHSTSHPYLDDHRVEGRAVAPMALVLQWFHAAAVHTLGEPVAVHDLRVLRPIVVEGPGGDWVLVTATRDGDSLVLHADAADGTPRYRARATGGEAARARTDVPETGELAGPPETPLYGGDILFHGPGLELISRLSGLSATAAAAEVTAGGIPGLVGLLDAALQLAVVWGHTTLGGQSLPMAVRSLRLGPGDRGGALRCVLVGEAKDGQRAVSDLVLIDEAGAVVAELAGVENVLKPGADRGASGEARA